MGRPKKMQQGRKTALEINPLYYRAMKMRTARTDSTISDTLDRILADAFTADELEAAAAAMKEGEG